MWAAGALPPVRPTRSSGSALHALLHTARPRGSPQCTARDQLSSSNAMTDFSSSIACASSCLPPKTPPASSQPLRQASTVSVRTRFIRSGQNRSRIGDAVQSHAPNRIRNDPPERGCTGRVNAGTRRGRVRSRRCCGTGRLRHWAGWTARRRQRRAQWWEACSPCSPPLWYR